MTFRRDFSLNSHFNIRNTTSCVTSEMTRVPPPRRFFPGCEPPLTLRYEQRCPLRRWRAGWSRDLVILKSSYTLPWTLDLSEHAPFCKQGQKSSYRKEKMTSGQRAVTARNGGALLHSSNQPKRLTLSRCACVWSVMDLADLWAAAALFHLPIRGFSPSGRGRKGREMC